ncbi:MAG: phosphomannomutase/phosphoglucomutase [Bacillota bacterium]
MTVIDLLKLESGSDIRGRAIAVKQDDIELTEEVVEKIGKAFAFWLGNKLGIETTKLKIGIGHDSRLSADKLCQALSAGIKAAGSDTYLTGLASTPAMFMSTVFSSYNYDGAVMITASHLPSDKNGFKFFTKEGGLEKENIQEILKLAAENNFNSIERAGQSYEIDLMEDYTDHLKTLIRSNLKEEVDQEKPLNNFKIILDAGNGSGGFFVNKILKPLGAETEGSQFLEPDGNFPNHPPNPEDRKAMASIQQAVRENAADLGIIFDTDVDRAAVVDSDGNSINRNKLIALASAIVLEENPGATIVTDSVTSVGLNKFIEDKLGGKHHRFKRGYKNVINEAIRLENKGINAPLAIETSGHAALKENYFLDDGAYLVAKILIKMANLSIKGIKLKSLIKDLEEANIKKEFRMDIILKDYKEYGQQVIDDLKDYVDENSSWELAPDNYQGVRINTGGNDWFLLRMSLHDPVLVLNIECDTDRDLNKSLMKIKEFLKNYNSIKNIEF